MVVVCTKHQGTFLVGEYLLGNKPYSDFDSLN